MQMTSTTLLWMAVIALVLGVAYFAWRLSTTRVAGQRGPTAIETAEGRLGGRATPRLRTSTPPPAPNRHVAGIAPAATPAPASGRRSSASPPTTVAAGGSKEKGPPPAEPDPAVPHSRAKGSVSTSARAEITRRLAEVRSWGYQLQDLDLAEAAASPFDLLVIDYARDGTDGTALKSRDLERLKRKPDGGARLVYAYISVGEAESYRFYWHDAWKTAPPPWLLGENRHWAENYRVAYWDEAWQRILFGGSGSYVDRIAAAGFDGLYLDRCDVHDDIARFDKRLAKTRSDLEGDMADFVARLTAYARREHPQLGIVMQNAEHLLERASVRQAIDAIAKEELLFGETGGSRRNARAVIADSRSALDLLRREGKPVLVVEYLDDPAKQAAAREEIASLGYVAYVSKGDRGLDTLETGATGEALTS